PPLCHSPSDRERASTSDSTPVATPGAFEPPWPSPFGALRKEKEPDLWFSRHKKNESAKPNSNSPFSSSWEFASESADPLFDDSGEIEFPLLPDSPQDTKSGTMAASAAPIDISRSGQFRSSTSPRNHTSTLTLGLQEAAAAGQQSPAINYDFKPPTDSGRLSVGGRHDSISNHLGSSYYGSGARPISMKDRARRESNTAGSLVGGMSWGGVSVGSWVRDDVMMAGTSPTPFGKSPSLHSSSYLPKKEASYLSGYSCCGETLDSLHDLLQHFEENHAQQNNQTTRRTSVSTQGAFASHRRPSTGINPADSLRNFQGFQTPTQARAPTSGLSNRVNQTNDGFNRTQLSTVQDMDPADDMELDDATPVAPQHRSHYGQQESRMTPLNTSIANAVPAPQAFRTSTPSTPATTQPFSLFNNPTVSSVNTPALSTQTTQQLQSRISPESSAPGTPAELDQAFAGGYMGGMAMGMQQMGNQMSQDNLDFNTIGFNLAGNVNDMTIDDPAKRLFSKQGGSITAAQLQYALKHGHIGMDSELAKKLREQQLVGGAGGMIFPEPENKPFRCPVIGCEKAYKNQNGLKYHKQHGHTNQKLKENEDGTFSIVDPVTSIPYPGTVGMEKEKPYRCEVCGKRYKNLNGLKYHRQHSPHCNPDLKIHLNMPSFGNLQGLNPNANIAGAGLVGMGDTNMF
ncbi:hypothetical protein EJ06DRAFT_474582, partial [Trichodelitschia bisporula]